MKPSSIINKLSAIALIGFLSGTAFASDQFFEVGKSYLFVPRINMVMKGTVTQITDQEVVFTDRSILKSSKVPASAQNDDSKSAAIKGAAITEFLKSKNREALLEHSKYAGPISYSRSALTAIKIDN